MLLCDVRHIRKDYRESDGKDARHGDDCKVPPESRSRLNVRHSQKNCVDRLQCHTVILIVNLGIELYSAVVTS